MMENQLQLTEHGDIMDFHRLLDVEHDFMVLIMARTLRSGDILSRPLEEDP